MRWVLSLVPFYKWGNGGLVEVICSRWQGQEGGGRGEIRPPEGLSPEPELLTSAAQPHCVWKLKLYHRPESDSSKEKTVSPLPNPNDLPVHLIENNDNNCAHLSSVLARIMETI